MSIILDTFLNENYLKNNKDLYLNVEDWKPYNKNILLITGLSGSGKSTLSRNIAIINNAILISLDKVSHYIKNNDKYEISHTEDELDILNKFSNKYNSKDYDTQFNNFFDFIFEYADKNKDKLFILEGIQIISKNMCNYIKENNLPIIIKGTSATLSFIRQIKRSISIKSFKYGMGNNPFYADKYLKLFFKDILSR